MANQGDGMDYGARQARVRETYPAGTYVQDPVNVAYLCGLHVHPSPDRPCRLELPPSGPARLVLNRVYGNLAADAYTYFDGEQVPSPDPAWSRADDLVKRLRFEKDQDELERIRAAADLASWGQQAYRDALERGGSLLELRFEVGRLMAAEASKREPGAHWDLRVAGVAGAASANPHAPADSSGRVVQRGDVVVAVIVVGKDGYHAECERTYLLGRPTESVLAPFEAVVRAQAAAIRNCIAGRAICALDQASRAVLRDAGFDQYVLHRAGHGMGLSPQEAPLDSPANASEFTASTVMAIEPGIYVPGVGGFRHSDTILAGPEVLTDYPRDADALILPVQY
jgi:Xaa-Pro aminopeptidase